MVIFLMQVVTVYELDIGGGGTLFKMETFPRIRCSVTDKNPRILVEHNR
jgi:hypothetical protein